MKPTEIAYPATTVVGVKLRRNIGRMLRERGWDHSDLYGLLGMARNQYAQLFRSERGPTVATLCRIAEALGVATEELLREDEQ